MLHRYALYVLANNRTLKKIYLKKIITIKYNKNVLV